MFIEPGSPWENGYIESFNGKLRDELLKREVFDTLYEAQVLIERWRQEYNTVRPHSSLGYRPPAPEDTTSEQFNSLKYLGKIRTKIHQSFTNFGLKGWQGNFKRHSKIISKSN